MYIINVCAQDDGSVSSVDSDMTGVSNSLKGVLTWTCSELLPCLCDPEVGLSGWRVSEKLVEAVLRMCRCLLLAGTPDNQLLDQVVQGWMAVLGSKWVR